MTVTTEMTFTSGVTSSNFDTIKDDLKEAIATALGVDSSMIELTLKSSITRSTSTVVVVTITSTDEDVVGDVEDAIESNSFVSTVNSEISSSAALSSAGVTLDSVSDPTVEGLPEPPEAEKKPDPPCNNIQDYRRCGKAAMKGKCAKPWWQWQCKATCRRCCGNIWPNKRCRKLKFMCKKKGKEGREVRNKCRKACKKC